MKPSTRSTQSASPPTSWTARLRGRQREGGREGGGGELGRDTVAEIMFMLVDRQTQTGRQTDRDTSTDRERETDRDRDRQR